KEIIVGHLPQRYGMFCPLRRDVHSPCPKQLVVLSNHNPVRLTQFSRSNRFVVARCSLYLSRQGKLDTVWRLEALFGLLSLLCLVFRPCFRLFSFILVPSVHFIRSVNFC